MKTLVFRLSSLGDVILAAAVLPGLARAGGEIHWVVAREYSDLLKNHPLITKLWQYDRATGFRGWRALCSELEAEGFDHLVDVHQSFRTFYAMRRFKKTLPKAQQTKIKKDRLKKIALFLFKKGKQKNFTPFVERFSLLGGAPDGRPDFKHLLNRKSSEIVTVLNSLPQSQPFLAVMAASRWKGKEWSVLRYAKTLELLKGKFFPILLGTADDVACTKLASSLEALNVPYFSMVGKLSLSENAQVLGQCKAYLGNDTGLAHLAEAVGIPSFVIFGPTSREIGFAPWRNQSRILEQPLWCRPCGKDGRYCFRVMNRFQCMKNITVEHVKTTLEENIL